jgi:hypothetical protein
MAHEPDVHAPVADRVALVPPAQAREAEADGRMPFAEEPQRGVDVHPEHEPHRQQRAAGRLTCAFLGVPRGGQQPAAVAQELLTARREGDLPARTGEQFDADIVFELLDLAGERGLGDVQRRGGLPEMEVFGDNQGCLSTLRIPTLTCENDAR